MTTYHKKIIKELKNLDDWRYAGGEKNQHLNYFNLLNLQKPEKQDNCLCDHSITENCYIYNKSTNELKVLGNCCIKKFLKKSSRTCEKCDQPHRNRIINQCNKCRYQFCNKCNIEKYDEKYDLCRNCYWKKTP